MAGELWRKSLEVLRRQFEEASFRNPDLIVTLVEADDDNRDKLMGPPGERWTGDDPRDLGFTSLPFDPPRLRELTPEEIAAADPADETIVPDPETGKPLAARVPMRLRNAHYRGTRGGDALAQFDRLARGAGRLLRSLPRDVVGVIPLQVIWRPTFSRQKIGPYIIEGPEPGEGPGREESRWLLALFHLAWLRHPESALHATRQTWVEMPGGTHLLPYEEGELRSLLATETLSGLRDKVKLPPTHFYSKLPFDVFLSSLLAVDILLHRADAPPAEAAEPSTPSTPKPSADATVTPVRVDSPAENAAGESQRPEPDPPPRAEATDTPTPTDAATENAPGGAQQPKPGRPVKVRRGKKVQAWAAAYHQTGAVIFTDMKGSQKLNVEVGDHDMVSIKSAHRSKAGELSDGHSATYYRWTGDGVLCTFPTAYQALDFALALQGDPGHHYLRRAIRAGIHVGAYVIKEGELDGDTINFAASLIGKDTSRDATIRLSVRARDDVLQHNAPEHRKFGWRPEPIGAERQAPGQNEMYVLELPGETPPEKPPVRRGKPKPGTGGASKPRSKRTSKRQRKGRKGR